MNTISEKTILLLSEDGENENSPNSISAISEDIGELDFFLDNCFRDAVNTHDTEARIVSDRSELIRKLIADQGLTELRTVEIVSPKENMPVRGGLKPGSTVGNCEVGELLASGGCGHVFRGKHKQLGIDIAVKVLDAGQAAKVSDLPARFLHEAQTLAKLRHQHVVRIYDVGTYKGLYYLVMDFVEGVDLAQYIRKNGRMPLVEAHKIMQQVLSALAAVHKAGIIHRDLKPANIMLDKGGDAILMDFGLAKEERFTIDGTRTVQGALMGTPQFMAPEQIDDPASVSPATDVYSLGLTFYQLLTGVAPIDGKTLLDVLNNQKYHIPVAPHLLHSEIPLAISQMIMTMISKDSADRYQDVPGIAAALAAASLLDAPEAGPQQLTEADNRGANGRGLPRWLLLGLVVGSLALAAGVAFLWLPGGKEGAAAPVVANTGWHARPRIFTVLPFTGAENYEAVMAAQNAIQRKGYRAVEREQIDQILTEISLAKDKMVSADTSVRVGKLTGAQIVITGFVSDKGILARAYDVETSEILAMQELKGENLDDQFVQFLNAVAGRMIYRSELVSSTADTCIFRHGQEFGAAKGMKVRILGSTDETVAIATILSLANNTVTAHLESSNGPLSLGMRVEEIKE